jgi:replication factor A2
MGDFGNYGMGGGMGGSDFGNSGGGGGGGFMQSGNNNFGGGMNPSQSSQGQGVDGEQRLTNTTPCSIGMLMKAEESNNAFVVDGRPASRVTFYGRVLDMEAKATNMRYVLDDGSGVIEVTNWNNMDTGAEVLQTSPVNVGNYVAVVGQIRSFNNKVQINAFNLRVVQDMNELTHHFLEVISAHVQVHKGPLNPALRVSQQQPQQQVRLGRVFCFCFFAHSFTRIAPNQKCLLNFDSLPAGLLRRDL